MTSSFDIKHINLFSSWVYNLPKNTDCTICRCNLNVSSLYNQEKGIESIVVTGVCDHSFHYDCIKPWIEKNKHCPICSTVWQYQQKSIEKEPEKNVKKINIIGNKPLVPELEGCGGRL